MDANQLNFSGGPGALPHTVLEQVQQSILDAPGAGLSILGVSHRSQWFLDVINELQSNILTLMGLNQDYQVLLLQGGATQQFTMIPMSFLQNTGKAADMLHTGYWSGKALPEAQRLGPVNVLFSGQGEGFTRLPVDAELAFSADAAYLHYMSNETVEGLQFHRVIGRDDVPRFCDMSSDFLSNQLDFSKFDLIYAHAQKNLGPSGVTVVVVKKSLLDRAPEDLPAFLDYRKQMQANSILNTPPVFAIYVVLLLTRWLRNEIGGLANMGKINREKARTLYEVIDASKGFYQPRVQGQDRSMMNVTFTLQDETLHSDFLAQASKHLMSGLEGHRSVGGFRASLYNGLTLEAVRVLADFMKQFNRQHA